MTHTTNHAMPFRGAILDIRIRASAKASTRPSAKDTSISGTEMVSPALNMGQKESRTSCNLAIGVLLFKRRGRRHRAASPQFLSVAYLLYRLTLSATVWPKYLTVRLYRVLSWIISLMISETLSHRA